jgi:CdiI N-terminal domain
MKKFNIQVISKEPKKIYSLLSHTGQITIGDFTETFIMPLDNWPIEEYQQQWKKGIERLKTHKYSCLVATVQNLETNGLVNLWLLYKDKDTIFIQNELLNKSILQEMNIPLKMSDFNSTTCYDFITYPRVTLTECGAKISEWSISTKDFFKSTN